MTKPRIAELRGKTYPNTLETQLKARDKERSCYSGQTMVEPDRVIAIYHGVEAENGIASIVLSM